MPKQKTRKAVAKKVKVTGAKKLVRRHTKQNHYNSRQSGNATRKKRRDLSIFESDAKNIIKALPHA